MAINQKNVSKMFNLLSNEIRRDILLIVYEKNEQSFTDLMINLKLDTGKLSFHIRNLKIFLEQSPTGKYKLNKLGQHALRLIRDFESFSIETDINQSKTALPLASKKRRISAFLIDLGVAFTITIAATLLPNLSILFSGTYNLEFNILLLLSLLWLYSTLLEGFSGQTIGKAALGLKLLNVAGKKIYYDNAAVRNFGKCFLLPFDLLIGLRIKDKRFIKYFDKFSGITVINIKP